MVVVQRRHEAVFGVKRNRIGARPGLSLLFAIDSGLHGKRQQRALHGIALDLPCGFVPPQHPVIAPRGGASPFSYRRAIGGVGPLVSPAPDRKRAVEGTWV